MGLDRTYVRVPGDPRLPKDRHDAWLTGLKAGASIATNGALVGLTVNGQHPGSRIELTGKDLEVRFEGFLRSTFEVNHLEVVLNGKVIESFDKADGQTSANISGRVRIEESGWLLLRAWSDDPHPLVLDVYPYAPTSPVYITVNGKPPRSEEDADYFLTWIGNLRAAVNSHKDFNSDQERDEIIQHLDQAGAYYERCR